MAIFKPGSIVGAISGNLGGVNFALGKGTPIVRQRIRKKDPKSELQLDHRALITFVTGYWRTLDPQVRTMWTVAATKFPVTNRLGLTKPQTPFHLFMRCFVPYWTWLKIPLIGPPIGPDTIPFHTITLDASEAGAIEFTIAPPPWPTFIVKIFASRPFTSVPPAHFPNLKFMTISMGDPLGSLTFTSEFDAAFAHPLQGEAILATASIFSPGHPPAAPHYLSTIVVA